MWGFHKTYPRLGLLKKPGSQVGTSCLPFSPPGAIAFISIARRALRVQRSDSARSLSLLSSIFSFDLFFCQNSRLAHSRRQKMHLFLEDDLKGGEGRRTFVGGKEAHTHTSAVRSKFSSKLVSLRALVWYVLLSRVINFFTSGYYMKPHYFQVLCPEERGWWKYFGRRYNILAYQACRRPWCAPGNVPGSMRWYRSERECKRPLGHKHEDQTILAIPSWVVRCYGGR